MNIKSYIKIIALTSLFLFSLFSRPPSVLSIQIYDEKTEASIGRKSDPGILKMYGLYDDKVLQGYVSGVGQSLVDVLDEPIFEFNFKVIDSSEINAFALPGGYIYVTRGILSAINSEAELAGILGHEIGHVIAHHGVKQLTKSLGLTLLSLGGVLANPKEGGKWLMVSRTLSNQILLGYGREAELEADVLGLLNASQAGYDPTQMAKFLKGLRYKEMLAGQTYHSFQSTHPDTRDRIIRAEDMAYSLARGNTKKKLYSNRFLSHIAGLKYGGKRNIRDKRIYRKEKFIDLYTVQPGDSFETIAREQLGDSKKEMDIAVLNNRRQKDRLKPGETIKIVRQK